MEFKEFRCNIARKYNINVDVNHDLFYEKNSINDDFDKYLKGKYGDAVESYIKPFGSFSRDGDNISSFMFKILDHSHIYKGYITQVNIGFERINGNLYKLREMYYGYQLKTGEILFNDVIDFMDNWNKCFRLI